MTLRLSPEKPLATAIPLGADDTLKIILTTVDGGAGKKPHQAFLTLREPAKGLEESFPLSVRETGKGKLELVSLAPIYIIKNG